jgi:hypothetical protein
MKHSQTVVDVANIVRHFLQNEAQTLKISKGKILKDKEFDHEVKKYLHVG